MVVAGGDLFYSWAAFKQIKYVTCHINGGRILHNDIRQSQ